MKTGFVFSITAVLLAVSASAPAYPEPAVVQKINEWTLKVEYAQPEQIMLRIPGQASPQRFWYLILTVTNQGPQEEVDFYPVCELVTDTFKITPAGRNIRQAVFEAIKLKHQARYPFLESLDFKDHRVARGEDNTRDFVIIWPDIDPRAREVSLYLGGLSNETAVIEHPVLTDENGNPARIFLQKTLQLKYALPGDEAFRANAALKEIEQSWVMR